MTSGEPRLTHPPPTGGGSRLARTRRLSPRYLPARYLDDWRAPFLERATASLRPGAAVLDVGSGRKPSVPPPLRPERCRYVGLDVSREELLLAPADAYDALVVHDVSRHRRDLSGRFDLIVTWQVLEHVTDVQATIDNLFDYLRPGGALVAQLSGAWSIYALANRLIPHRLAAYALARLLDRPVDTVFRASYDRCYASALERLFAGWADVQVTPRFKAGTYLDFAPALRSLYLLYEDTAERRGWRNLATHYLVAASRP